MLRSMMLDVLKCPKCSGRMKVIACLDQPEVVEKFLKSKGLWTENDDSPAANPPRETACDLDDTGPPDVDESWPPDAPLD